MRQHFLVRVVAFTAVMVFIMVAGSVAVFAADTTPAQAATGIGAELRDLINGTVVPVIVALIGSLVSLLLLKVKAKMNMQLSAETENWIRQQAEAAVQLVAEKSAAKIDNGMKISSNEKLNMAMAALFSRVPHLTKEQADQYIHAALARIPGLGATGISLAAPK